MQDLGVFSGLCYIPPPDDVSSHCWRSSEILHHEHAEEAKQSSSEAIPHACQAAEQLY